MLFEPLIAIAVSLAAQQGAPAVETHPAPPSMILDNSYNAFVAVEETPALKDMIHSAIYARRANGRPAIARNGVSPIS